MPFPHHEPTLTPPVAPPRRALRRRHDGDAGSVLVVAVIVSFVIAGAVTVALTTSSASIQQSGAYDGTTSARLAAESGIQASFVQMQDAAAVADLPCSSTSPTTLQPTSGAVSEYTVTLAYVDGSGVSLACDTGQPAEATITATGTSGKQRVVMQASVAISTQPPTQPAFDYALYSQTSANVTGGYIAGGQRPGSVYGGSRVTCSNGHIQADAFTNDAQLSAACQLGGSVQAASSSVSFPVINPTRSDFQGDQYVTVSSCKTSASSGQASWLSGELAKATSSSGTLVIDATGCGSVTLSGGSSLTGSCSSYSLPENVILLTSSLELAGCNQFSPSRPGSAAFSIVVPDTGQKSGASVTVGSQTSFSPSVNLLVYTPGQAHFSCHGSVSGQIVAGSRVSTSGSFTLKGSDGAARTVPQATQPTGLTVQMKNEVLLKD